VNDPFLMLLTMLFRYRSTKHLMRHEDGHKQQIHNDFGGAYL